MTRVGAVFNPYQNPPEAFRAAVEAAEAAGVPELWVWEDCFRQAGYAAASAALAWTDRLRLGIGITPLPLRNVAVSAMEIATLERTFPGRVLPGVGHGVQSWMQQVGARAASPLTLMREQVPALRALLSGEEVSVAGRYVTLDAVRLDWPPAVAPLVYAAAEGPKTLRVAGEVADGVVLNSGYSPAQYAGAIAAVLEGRRAVGREGDADIVAYVVAGFGRHGSERARATLRETAAPQAAIGGTVDEVAAGVAAFARVGVHDVVLLPPRDETDLTGYLRQVGEVAQVVARDAPH